ncbi:MAG: lipid-A-disaccharide synthase [Bacteroidales bacterium]|nr:lipid-A-disaccharide synthase [Bacteroidales bacterium]
MKYYITAGEASGDLHASNLMKALKNFDNYAEFRFIGGDLMKEQGGTLVRHFKDTAYMGFLDVFMHLPAILKNIKFVKKDILDYKPDVIILVDYPGFNLRIAEFAHNAGLKVYYYISPKIWAWKQSRVHKIKAFVDKMFIIFPFEKDFYKKYDYEVEYVGNPILDAIDTEKKDIYGFKKKYNLNDKKIIALLPGSRKQEIKHNFPLMLKVTEKFPDYQFIVAAAPSLEKETFFKYTNNEDVKLIYNDTYEILKHSEAALVTSGTATLETAVLNIPELVCYKGDNLSYHIAKHLVKVDYISLVNLVMHNEIIKEFIQYDMTVKNITEELKLIIEDNVYRNTMLLNFARLREILGGKGASDRTAEIIVENLNNEQLITNNE